ncbi:MAG: hypothetical protein ACRDS9_12475 [Pseudonocardiaceae bacterium]
MAYILDAGTTITCPHGGRVTVAPRATRVSLAGKPPLLVDDTAVIAACPLVQSPCLSVRWVLPATRVTVESSPVLLSSSIALCLNVANAPQGTALLTGFQTRVRAQ